jgi:hypothetical protein
VLAVIPEVPESTVRGGCPREGRSPSSLAENQPPNDETMAVGRAAGVEFPSDFPTELERRVMAVAFEMARAALQLGDQSILWERLARRRSNLFRNLLEQAHLDERLLERSHRLGVEHAVVGEDADLLVIGAADHRRAQVEHLGGDVHGRLVGLHESSAAHPVCNSFEICYQMRKQVEPGNDQFAAPSLPGSERMLRAALLSAISLLCCWWAALADEFKLDCHPFSLPAQAKPIDGRCGAGGSAAPNTPKRLQNEAKNTLCSQGNAVTLTMADFMALQGRARQLGISFGAEGSPPQRTEHLPQDRTKLQSKDFFTTMGGHQVGEGSRVQIVGFMNEPHPGGAEDVNCGATAEADKDVHVNLVESPAPWLPPKDDPDRQQKEAERNAELCKGIVVETIPHFRPAPFEARALRSVSREFPVLISGQLFFDASHFPCEGSQPHSGGHPARGSLWEIHPITDIQVCKNKTLSECSPQDRTVWVPLHAVPAHMIAVEAVTEMNSEPDED